MTVMAETCRDVLADMLAAASNISDFDDLLDFHGFSTDRIRAAIAADDAKRERATMASDQPSDLLALSNRLRQLSDLVAKQDFGGGEWTMRVPAEPHRDADLVLSSAATLVSEVHDLRNVRAELKAARGEIARLRRIEEAARDVDDTHSALMRAAGTSGALPTFSAHKGALASLSVALLPPIMRQLDAAQRIAGDGGRDDD